MIKKFFRSLFLLRRGEQQALFVIMLFLMFSIFIRIWIEGSFRRIETETDASFKASMNILREEIERKSKIIATYEGAGVNEKMSEITPEINRSLTLFRFDPNTITTDSLARMNLPRNISGNLVKYRQAGGKFRSPRDLLKIYGMDTIIFNQLSPFISIAEIKKPNHEFTHTKDEELKYSLEINTTDSLMLQLIPGVGPVYASRIIKYRELLGGFYDKEQFWDIYGMDSILYNSIAFHTIIDTSKIRRIGINSASFRDLISHPYMNRASTYALLQYRDFSDTIISIKEIRSNQIIDDEIFTKLRPYISMD